MRVSVFSTKPYDRHFLERVNAEQGYGHELVFFDARLEEATAPLARGTPAVCAFVNDELGRPVLTDLAAHGTRLVALRSAGFNNVDLSAARDLGLTVMHVPDYSPYAVAEFTIALILALDRHLARAYTHVREGNFSLQGLLGSDLHGKTAGIVGTGKIGGIVARDAAARLRLPRPGPRPVPQRAPAAVGGRVRGPRRAAAGSPTSSACTARSRRRRTTSSTGAASPA